MDWVPRPGRTGRARRIGQITQKSAIANRRTGKSSSPSWGRDMQTDQNPAVRPDLGDGDIAMLDGERGEVPESPWVGGGYRQGARC